MRHSRRVLFVGRADIRNNGTFLKWYSTLITHKLFCMNDDILVVTTNDVPGYEVVKVYGEVFGVLVRSRNLVSNIGAGLQSIFGGEIDAYTKLISDSRIQAVERMKKAAHEKGANAILMMRFDTGEIGQTMNEVAAYGTAVTIRPLSK